MRLGGIRLKTRANADPKCYICNICDDTTEQYDVLYTVPGGDSSGETEGTATSRPMAELDIPSRQDSNPTKPGGCSGGSRAQMDP